MDEKRTIAIDKNISITMFKSLILCFLVLFIISHFGDFTKTDIFPAQFDSNGELLNVYDMPVKDNTPMDMTYYSPLGSVIRDNEPMYVVRDGYPDGKANTYFVKLSYYLRSISKQWIYLTAGTIVICFLILFFKKFKFAFK